MKRADYVSPSGIRVHGPSKRITDEGTIVWVYVFAWTDDENTDTGFAMTAVGEYNVRKHEELITLGVHRAEMERRNRAAE